MKNQITNRDFFRKKCLQRDGYKCVICGSLDNLSVHHIIERRLFPLDMQYQTFNGSTLCGECHLKAGMTILSVEQIREACGIQEKDKVLPEHLYPDQVYDKWANPILDNGTRLRGELFDDVSVQKILEQGDVLSLFSKYVKYPRTLHLPWSPGKTDDDRVLKDTSCFENKEVVVTLKIDGENANFYNDFYHARSLTGKNHWSRSWIKNFHSKICHEIPEDMRFVLENLYAKHSIHYKNLENYCYGISVWKNLECLSWDETVEWFNLFDIPTVPVLYRGIWDENKVKECYVPYLNGDECEGYVVRLADSFHYKDFSKSIAKYVRKDHVKTSHHWKYDRPEKNELKSMGIKNG
jgi:hypothetical protein